MTKRHCLSTPCVALLIMLLICIWNCMGLLFMRNGLDMQIVKSTIMAQPLLSRRMA